MNKYWAIWGDGDFVEAILFFITAIAIAFYFEIKYLDERKKNKELHDLFIQYNKPPTAPLNPIIINQKSKAGKFTLGDVPKVIASPSPTMPANKTKRDLITFSLTFIKRIIRGLNKSVNQKGTIP